MWQYVDFYNNPTEYPLHGRSNADKMHSLDGGITLHDIVIDRPPETFKGEISIEGEDLENFDFILEYPLKLNKKYQGTLDFGLRIKVRNNYDEKEDKNMWKISVGHAPKTKLKNWNCKDAAENC